MAPSVFTRASRPRSITTNGLAYGACRLPNDAGLVFKVLGRETAQVRAKVREFWGIARQEITGTELPPAFFWR